MATTADARRLRTGLASSASGFWLVSLSPVIVAGSSLHGVSMAFWRCWLGLLGVGTIALLRKSISWAIIRQTSLPAFCFGSSIGLFFWASQITSIANASLITVLQPIVLMVGARYMYREFVTAPDIFWAVVAIGGAVLLVLAGDSGGTGDIRGDLLAAFSIVLGSGYFIFGKRVLEIVPVVAFMTGVFLWAGLWLSLAVIISGLSVAPSTDGDWVRIAAIALFPGAGHVLLNIAQNHAPLNLMGAFQLIIPVNATLMAFWFLDQNVTALQLVGMLIVTVALIIQALLRSRAADPVIDLPLLDR